MKIETPAEAFAAIAAVMVGADGIGTDAEREFLLHRLSRWRVFQDMEAVPFEGLLERVCDAVWASLPNDGVRITQDGLEDLIQACGRVLDPALRAEACTMAEALADVDQRTTEEQEVVGRLRAGFGLADA